MTMNVDARPNLRVRYWAGAAEAAGSQEEALALGSDDAPGLTGRDVRRLVLSAHPGMEAVLARCSLLHAGRRLADDAVVDPDEVVEVLPPFVGG